MKRGRDRGRIGASLLLGLEPPPRLTVDEWADSYRVIGPPAPEPGKWRTDRAPYQRGILRAITDPGVETVVLMSSSQIGKSEVILNVLGYYLHLDPCAILLVQPTLEMAEDFSKTRVASLLRDTPVLSKILGKIRARDAQSTLLFKQFPGGFLAISGANSPAGLASRPVRLLLLDEVDRYPATAGAEGDPVNLARKRTTNYWHRKILMASTPTTPQTSRIAKEWALSDQRRYYVPCPHCGSEQILIWQQIRWDPDAPQDAWYECIACRGKIHNYQKPEMLRKGRWVPHGTAGKVVGFAIWEAYSPWRTWGDVVQSYLAAKDDPMLLQVWHNTCLGEPWQPEEGIRQDWEMLLQRAESYPLWGDPLPDGVQLLTAGVDVQADRLEWVLVGWGAGYEAWILGYERIFGDPITPRPWDLLDQKLAAEYGGLPIMATCVDAGYRTEEVYTWVRGRQNRRIMAVKGANQPGRPILGRPTLQDVSHQGKIIKRGIRLWSIGTDTAKGTLYGRLALQDPGPQYVHIPDGMPDLAEYLRGLCSEKLVTRYRQGQPVQVWERVHPRNEPLDTLVYALAAVLSLGRIRWENINKCPKQKGEAKKVGTHSPTPPEVPRRAPPEEEWSVVDW